MQVGSARPPCKILCIVGARPNFMKMAPILAALKALENRFAVTLVHTGQHYDAVMNQQYFDDLGMQPPDVNLEVGSASHAVQTAEVMRRFEPVLDADAPDAVLVVGDVNSSLACALVAVKKAIPVIHVEAGLRSFDRAMPEEINRVLIDQIATLLFTTEAGARANLLAEGIAENRIHLVGNVMIDSLHRNLDRAVPMADTVSAAGRPGFGGDANGAGHAVLTLHRPSNVDDPAVFEGLLKTVARISERTPVIFPAHPRTRAKIAEFGLARLLEAPGMLITPPLGYLEMLGLMRQARVVLTDSGGIQEETTALGVPCITLRNSTERPITVDEGSNTVAGTEPARIMTIYEDLMRNGGKANRIPQYWDGRAAQRIAEITAAWFDQQTQQREQKEKATA